MNCNGRYSEAILIHVASCESCLNTLDEYVKESLERIENERSTQHTMARPKKADFSQEDLQKLTEWNNKAKELTTVKEKEFELRQSIVFEMGVFDPEKLEGSQTIEISAYPGWKLSADKVMNYSCVGVPEILEVQNLIGSATGLNRPDLAQNLVKYKPELSVKAYRDALAAVEQAEKDGNPDVQALAAKLKAAMAKAITIKKGAPQLELIAPKE